MSRRYEWWAWSGPCGIISPHFSSKAKAKEWMNQKTFVNKSSFSLQAKIKEDCNEINQ